jgi:hypothetical protein
MAKEKVKVVGEPFNFEWSSCSNQKPKLFEWTKDEADLCVYIDYSITDNKPKIKKTEKSLNIGWLCESLTINYNLYNFIKNNYNKIFQQFDFIFTCDKYLLSLDHRFKFSYACSNMPWLEKDKWSIYKKSKNISMICSVKKMCSLHLQRQKIADKFLNYIDVFGGYLNSPLTGEKYADFYNKDNALKDYMFSIVVQNNNQPHFFAELLTDCFAYGTIPIYLGNPEINKFFNDDGIIVLNNEFDIENINSDLYYSKIKSIEENLDKIKEMPMSDDYLYTQYISLMENQNVKSFSNR